MTLLAPKNTVQKIATVIFLCIGTLFLSAFTYNPESPYMTRLEMAILLENILTDASISAEDASMPDYSDLSKQQKASISKVLSLKIMNGFSNNTFRPDVPMRNLEVISYLQKATEHIRNINPESEVAKRLFRFLSYNEDPGFAFEYDSLNLPKDLEQPNEQTCKQLFGELSNIFLNTKQNSSITLTGQIISSIDTKPVTTAYVSANRKATAVDKNGRFTIELEENQSIADIFATADGYHPTELRKDLKFGSDVTIRLRPVM